VENQVLSHACKEITKKYIFIERKTLVEKLGIHRPAGKDKE
jgi:hypothetical protein